MIAREAATRVGKWGGDHGAYDQKRHRTHSECNRRAVIEGPLFAPATIAWFH